MNLTDDGPTDPENPADPQSLADPEDPTTSAGPAAHADTGALSVHPSTMPSPVATPDQRHRPSPAEEVRTRLRFRAVPRLDERSDSPTTAHPTSATSPSW
ncbi:MAG: hypothetical protein U5R31_13150 [Acidimicrobiia bacterium]|nr:hypothetical protein [Acidimicrobiia bacterium]